MKKAIDKYAFGKQKEVIAWNGESISASSRRFFCPECLESVALDKRGHFRHQNRTSKTIECENRVASSSRTSYERMGLPYYLIEIGEQKFSLCVGFSPLTENELEEASSSGAYLVLSNGALEKRKYFISKERFNNDRYTLLKIEYLPEKKGRLKVEYSENTSRTIKAKWTDYTDLWGNGQFFKTSGECSRKVRPLGSITTDTDYYYIGDITQFYRYRKVVEFSTFGKLVLNRKQLPVYRIRICGKKGNEAQLRDLEGFLMENYKHNLLMSESGISPIWPPCIIDDNYFIFDRNCKEAIFAIESPNDDPTVYRYYGGATEVIIKTGDHPHLLKIGLSDDDIPISVDRTFNGNIQYIRRQPISRSYSDNKVDIIDEGDNSIIGKQLNTLHKKHFKIRSNCSATVFHIKPKGAEQQFRINDSEGVLINDISWGDTILVFSKSWSLLLAYTFCKQGMSDKENEDLLLLMKRQSGPYVNVDSSIRSYCTRIASDPEAKRYIVKYLKTNRIPIMVAKTLRERYGGY